MALTSSEVVALVAYLKQDDNLSGILVTAKAKLEASLSPGPMNLFGLVSPVHFHPFGFELLTHIEFFLAL